MTSFFRRMFLSGLLTAGMVLIPALTIEAQLETDNEVWPKTLIERVRDFLNLEPVEAVGGSRDNATTKLCLMSPVSSRNGTNHMIWVGLDDPILASSHPLNEIIIERSGIPVWSKLASSNQLIDQPISWPIAPLRPGERVTLKLRPVNASGMNFVEFYLIALTGKHLITTKNMQDNLKGKDMTIVDAIRHSYLLSRRDELAQLMSSRLAWDAGGAAWIGEHCR